MTVVGENPGVGKAIPPTTSVRNGGEGGILTHCTGPLFGGVPSHFLLVIARCRGVVPTPRVQYMQGDILP